MEETLKKVKEEVEKNINSVLSKGINTTTLEHLYKLIDIAKDIEEIKGERRESMNYGNYSNYGNYGDNYGRDNYGRRGYDARYRGYEHLGRMSDDYGRYMERRERYGANEDTKKSLRYMLESMEDFARMLKEEAQSQEEVQMIKETAQRIAQM